MAVQKRFDIGVVQPGIRMLAAATMTLALSSCQLPAPEPAHTPVPALPAAVVDASVAEQLAAEAAREDAERHRRYIADILYEGMRALRADRLMTPVEDSAYHYFSRVLAFEPDNTVAHDGMRDIALRYLQLADTASRQGQFDNAETFLRRAESVDDELPAIAAAKQRLVAARAQTHSVHTLDNRDLVQRQPAIARQLEDIARLAAEHNTFVLITAPNDELGRWIYAQLQASMTDARLRADIEIGEQASIRLVLPRTS
ncbi:MAG: hypothetical protein CMQ34_13765 [Gammaproteobacteria bacterium]|nr:hypothetical protein [Gammaproteobacteria bacterium]|tara:strand:+ start:1215 stop:1985 length:771 start_codon:yes stop_codon:yes gene_type:complete